MMAPPSVGKTKLTVERTCTSTNIPMSKDRFRIPYSNALMAK